MTSTSDLRSSRGLPPLAGGDVAARRLELAATVFAAAVLVHNADHVRRGVDLLSRDVFWTGTLALFVEVGVVVLVFMRHRLAPLAAFAAGVSLASGYAVVHFTPERSWLSDSLLSTSRYVSILAAGFETAAAVGLAAAGATVLRREAFLGGTRPLFVAFRHPVVAVMTIGNIAVLVASFVQIGFAR